MPLLRLTAVLLAAPTVISVGSEHYQIRAPETIAAESTELVEQLHVHLQQFFGRRPEGPLPVWILPDRRTFSAALAADRQPVADGGGYYAPENRTVYLFVQPSSYYTRQLLLHEATHQFHFLAATENRTPKAAWYVEGLADYFAMHGWDGKRLQCGRVPAVSLEDYPAAALAAIESHDAPASWLERVIDGNEPLSRPVSWALVHFLIGRDRKAFGRLAARLDRGDSPLADFQDTIGPVTGELARAFHRWVAAHQQPWSVVWTQWRQSGDTLEGTSETVGLLVHKRPLDRLELTIEPGNRPRSPETSAPLGKIDRGTHADAIASGDPVWKAGAVFGYRGENDFYLAQIDSKHRFRILRRTGDGWFPVFAAERPAASSRLLVECRGDRVQIGLCDVPVYDQINPGLLGLHVDACSAAFRVRVVPAGAPLRAARRGGADRDRQASLRHHPDCQPKE